MLQDGATKRIEKIQDAELLKKQLILLGASKDATNGAPDNPIRTQSWHDVSDGVHMSWHSVCN